MQLNLVIENLKTEIEEFPKSLKALRDDF